jgi:hypothetical protein
MVDVQRLDCATWGGELGTSLTVPRCSMLINQCRCFFDICAGIGQDSGGYGGLAWETAYVLNDKYMCPDPRGGSCGGAGWHYCAWLFSTREHLYPTVRLANVILQILLYLSPQRGTGT